MWTFKPAVCVLGKQPKMCVCAGLEWEFVHSFGAAYTLIKTTFSSFCAPSFIACSLLLSLSLSQKFVSLLRSTLTPVYYRIAPVCSRCACATLAKHQPAIALLKWTNEQQGSRSHRVAILANEHYAMMFFLFHVFISFCSSEKELYLFFVTAGVRALSRYHFHSLCTFARRK